MTPKREARVQHALRHRQPDLTIVLENVLDPHNVAAVLRTADAVGVLEICVINDQQSLHKYWGHRSARSAEKWVRVRHFGNAEECVGYLQSMRFALLAAAVGEQSVSLYEVDMCRPVALVFGNEKYGLSAALLSACSGRFTIPQVGMIVSLNISVACAVALYEAYRQRSAAGFYQQKQL